MPRALRLLLTANLILLAACSGGTSNALPAGPDSAPQGIVPQDITSSVGDDATRIALGRAPQYAAIRLPAGFQPSAMMPNGQIPGSIGHDAAIYQQGHVKILGTYGSEYAVATYVNDAGDAVGYSTSGPDETTPNVTGRALLFSNGKVQQLTGVPNTDFSDARAISNTGEIYGGSGSKLDLGGPRVLQLVEYSRTGAATPVSPMINFCDQCGEGNFIAINRSGTLTVSKYVGDGSIPDHAYIGTGLALHLLVTTTNGTDAYDLNDLGDVVGDYEQTGCSESQICAVHGYLYNATGLHFLSFLPLGINDSGTIDGADLFNGNKGSVVYKHGVKYALNSILTTGHLGVTDPINGLSGKGAFVVYDSNYTYYEIDPDNGDQDGNAP